MNMWLKIISGVSFRCVLLAILVVAVIVFANPLTLVSDIWIRATRQTDHGGGSSVVTDVKALGKLKVLKRFVGDFLELPESEEDKKHFHVIYQWEGMAEFTVDLSKVVRDTNTAHNCALLHMPKIEIENLRINPNINPRCVIKDASIGYGKKADAILADMPQYVTAEIQKNVGTTENIQLAKDQTEYLLESMIKVTRPGLRVEFDWEN